MYQLVKLYCWIGVIISKTSVNIVHIDRYYISKEDNLGNLQPKASMMKLETVCIVLFYFGRTYGAAEGYVDLYGIVVQQENVYSILLEIHTILVVYMTITHK